MIDNERNEEVIINEEKNSKQKKGKQKEKNRINYKSISNNNIYIAKLKGNNINNQEILNISKNNINNNINWIKYKSNSCRCDAFFSYIPILLLTQYIILILLIESNASIISQKNY